MPALIVVFLLALSTESMAQDEDSTELKDFEITIEKTDRGIQMQSSNGSAWLDLSFRLSPDTPQAVDEWGMTSLDDLSADEHPRLADYLFTISYSTNGKISLTGLEGTAWKELSFTLPDNGKQAIHQFGMME
jgi:hypothetical protein